MNHLPKTDLFIPEGKEVATLGAGCFWCIEAVFQRLMGVEQVVSGYSGGFVEDPDYRDICNGTTGHAEVSQITYDPNQVSFESLLEVFWATHDPTTLNRQGADVGPQYRSAIFYHSDNQRDIATSIKNELNEKKVFPRPIVTEISEFSNFYPAESYHQDYYNKNGYQPYCQFVVKPKVDKLKKYFSDRLIEDYR
ncbi:peptide-methionine (S)-S-oxide reductase MsrA [Algoriphagus sediminis]|uniref:Peptide methionine sulfoxide reductase MsrA n=1 Tax=Algoriphagus sediminis TaxID=3057113 RepID=A0ABT7YDW1_9BACT|nr:peptide-methionine (S)-S-oxide reductase MsrA [Algoriphagus sediminis]MDN3204555.1 peptide-methionine (S)-S-oxide reductase MsrA [Algoriphagus sediminis]